MEARVEFLLEMIQDPCCGLAYAFQIMSDEFIQVLHNGYWLTISTIGAATDEVFVFDSMYASVSTKVKHQIAALLATQRPSSSAL